MCMENSAFARNLINGNDLMRKLFVAFYFFRRWDFSCDKVYGLCEL